MPRRPRSVWVLPELASGCEGCQQELLACFDPVHDAARLGLLRAADPELADLLVVTGCVNAESREALRALRARMPAPAAVLAVGACAATGGVFARAPAVVGGADAALPVDLYVPGCAARPESIVRGLLAGAALVAGRRAARGTP